MRQECFSSINYDEFARGLYSRILSQRVPVCGTIELTRRCNLNCRHCYCNQPAGERSLIDRELNFEQWRPVLDECADKGCLWLLLTGGEPLLRNDFPEFYVYAKQKGFLISVFTNAVLINEQSAKLFREWPPAKIEITLYGSSPKVYEAITRVPGSFGACLRGMNLLKEANISFDIKTMLMQENKDDLENIRAIARQMGAGFRYDYLLHPRLDGKRSPCACRLSAEEAVEIEMKDEEKFLAWQRYIAEYEPGVDTKMLIKCGAGRNTFFIDPYGQMSVCSLLLKQRFDVKEFGFGRIWDEFFPPIAGEKLPGNDPCRGCAAKKFCDTCPGWNEVEGVPYEMPVDYLCQIAQQRKKMFEERLCGCQK